MARFLSDNKSKDSFSIYLFIILLLALIPTYLIIKQPDLGTAIVIFIGGVSILPVIATVVVSEGEHVKQGQVIVKIPRVTNPI